MTRLRDRLTESAQLAELAIQDADVDRLLANTSGGSCDASPPGSSGKTYVAVSYSLRLWASTVLVIGLRDVYPQWAKTYEDESDGFVKLRRINASKAGQEAMADYLSGVKGFYYVGMQYLAAKDHAFQIQPDGTKKRIRLKTWEKVVPDLIIVDEGHQVAARNSRGNNTLKWLKSPRRHIMSGTPAGNRFENFHSLALWLWPDLVDVSFHLWKQKWCKTENTYVPGGRAVSRVVGEKHPGEFVKTLPCYLRRDGATNEVPKAERILVEITPEQRRIYDQLEEQLLAWIGEHAWSIDWPVTLKTHLSTVTMAAPSFDEEGEIYFAPDAQSSKLDKAIEMVNGELRGEAVLHLTHSRRYVDLAVQRMRRAGLRVAAYTGKVSQVERARIKQAFIDGEIDHIVATTKTLGTGTDGLQTRCRTLIWHSQVDGDPTLYEQGARRIYRPGGDLDNFKHFEICAVNTKDEGVYSNVALKLADQKRSLRKAS